MAYDSGHEGVPVYFASQGGAAQSAQQPEEWIERVYADERSRIGR